MSQFKYLHNVATLKLDVDKCTGCEWCILVCPHEVFELDPLKTKKIRIRDLDACMECGACQMNCPFDALFVKTGVGCAAGVINGKLKGTDACC